MRGFLSFFLLGGLAVASPITLTFDDLTAGTQVGNQYAADGVNFSLTDNGIQVGLANGDPGNWGVNGDNGPYFDGVNGTPAYGDTLTFLSPVSNFSVDSSRTNGSAAGDQLTVSAFAGATLLGSQTITFGSVNTWTTVSLALSGITSVTIQGSGSGFHPFGIDNIVYTQGASTVPEPASAGLALIGAGRASAEATLVPAQLSHPA
jgi:hypothetical protein